LSRERWIEIIKVECWLSEIYFSLHCIIHR
jgi:hypothetical protein